MQEDNLLPEKNEDVERNPQCNDDKVGDKMNWWETKAMAVKRREECVMVSVKGERIEEVS